MSSCYLRRQGLESLPCDLVFPSLMCTARCTSSTGLTAYYSATTVIASTPVSE